MKQRHRILRSGKFPFCAVLVGAALILSLKFSGTPVLGAFQTQDEKAAKAMEAFLADNADAAAYQALLAHPQLFEDRTVATKISRSLTSADPATFRAAMELF